RAIVVDFRNQNRIIFIRYIQKHDFIIASETSVASYINFTSGIVRIGTVISYHLRIMRIAATTISTCTYGIQRIRNIYENMASGKIVTSYQIGIRWRWIDHDIVTTFYPAIECIMVKNNRRIGYTS